MWISIPNERQTVIMFFPASVPVNNLIVCEFICVPVWCLWPRGPGITVLWSNWRFTSIICDPNSSVCLVIQRPTNCCRMNLRLIRQAPVPRLDKHRMYVLYWNISMCRGYDGRDWLFSCRDPLGRPHNSRSGAPRQRRNPGGGGCTQVRLLYWLTPNC